MMMFRCVRVPSFGTKKISLHRFHSLLNLELKPERVKEGGSLKSLVSRLVRGITKTLVLHRSHTSRADCWAR